ncbi:hypothetical protein VPH35_024357 [Triticum aestivum]
MRPTRQLVLLLFLACILLLSTQTPGSDKLEIGQNLTDGDTLVSAGGSFTLGFFSPGASTKRYLGLGIWFSVSNDTVYWVANRADPLLGDMSGMLVFNGGGTLLLLDGSRRTLWSSDFSGGATAAAAQLLESGNLVVRNGSSVTYLWQSFDHPSDTLLSGMKLGRNFWTGAEWQLTSWRSADDPSPGDYRRTLESSGLPEIVTWYVRRRDDVPHGPLERGLLQRRPGGVDVPGQVPAACDGPHGQADGDNLRVHRRGRRSADSRRGEPHRRGGAAGVGREHPGVGLLLQQGGEGQYLRCLRQVRGVWPLRPRGGVLVVLRLCAGVQPRVAGGVANEAICGRVPARYARLDCGGGTTTDRFREVPSVRFPDTQNATVDLDMATLEECRDRRLADCSCLSYAAADIRGGGNRSGCVMWVDAIVDLRLIVSEQSLYLRLSESEFDVADGRKRFPIVPVVAPVASAAAILLVVFVIWWRWRSRILGLAVRHAPSPSSPPSITRAELIAGTTMCDGFGIRPRRPSSCL